ncbi:MAG: hypothetical protein M0Q98_11685 [Pseudomonas sp.]|nr:hypothetical protein [Pseudomonas sp.]
MSNTALLSVPLVLLCHQGRYFAFETVQVRRQTQTAPTEREQACSFAQLLDPCAADAGGAAQWLELAGAEGHIWLALDSAADLIQLAAADIYPLPALLHSRRDLLALRALGFYQGALVSVLDARALPRLAREPNA